MKTTALGLATFLLASLFFVNATTSISNLATGEYDPWADLNDDGLINIFDVVEVAGKYGTSGEPFAAKAALAYDSEWLNITDKQGQYFNIAHNLNTTDFFVDIQGKTTLGGAPHQVNLGLASYGSGWTRTYGRTNYESLGAIIQTTDGGYALAGYTESFGAGSQDIWLVKTDASGNLEWNKTYGGANSDTASSIVQTNDGGYALLGTTTSLGDTTGDFWLVKVDQIGNEQWNKTYSKANKRDRGRSLAYCNDGGFILAGVAEWTSSPWFQIWLIKTNSTGHNQWDYTYGQNVGYISTFTGYEHAVIETSDGGYAVAGARYPNPTYYSVWFFKTDENGTMLWHKTYGTTNHLDSGQSLVETSDGGYAIAGYTSSYGAGNHDFWLIKTNSTGDKVWDKTYGGINVDYASSMVQTSDGGYALVGYTQSFGAGSYDAWLVKTDSAGNMEWNKPFGGTSIDRTNSIVQTYDGGYALAGYTDSLGAGSSDGWMVRTDWTGTSEVESGLAWTDSTENTITLYRGVTDPHWNYVRIRIWKIKDAP